jgi:hypothetical protein
MQNQNMVTGPQPQRLQLGRKPGYRRVKLRERHRLPAIDDGRAAGSGQ